jgi:hypothetical protein
MTKLTQATISNSTGQPESEAMTMTQAVSVVSGSAPLGLGTLSQLSTVNVASKCELSSHPHSSTASSEEEAPEMDQRNSLFSSRGQQRAPGLPGRQVQRNPGGPPPDGGAYGSPRQQPSPAMPPRPGYDSSGGYGNYGTPSAPPPHQRTPSGYAEKQPPTPARGRQVPLRLMKIQDKTLQDRYIFGNV